MSHNLCGKMTPCQLQERWGVLIVIEKLWKYTRLSKLHFCWFPQVPEQLLGHDKLQGLPPWADPVLGGWAGRHSVCWTAWEELRRDCWVAASNLGQSPGPLPWQQAPPTAKATGNNMWQSQRQGQKRASRFPKERSFKTAAWVIRF